MPPLDHAQPSCASGVEVRLLDHRATQSAKTLHSIEQAAYAHEAALIGAVDFPPLHRTAADIRASSALFVGARSAGEWVAAVSIEWWPAPRHAIKLASLTVIPSVHRQGIGSALVSWVFDNVAFDTAFVSTARDNKPAVALYERFGFTVAETSHVGTERLALIHLRCDRTLQ